MTQPFGDEVHSGYSGVSGDDGGGDEWTTRGNRMEEDDPG
jgi:hypothetical protein